MDEAVKTGKRVVILYSVVSKDRYLDVDLYWVTGLFDHK